MSDRGAKALAIALATDNLRVHQPQDQFWFDERAAAILGTTGLFIADRTKHEPLCGIGEVLLFCPCGWVQERGESYFDHIGAEP